MNNPQWMNDMLLSPRSSYLKFADSARRMDFVCVENVIIH